MHLNDMRAETRNSAWSMLTREARFVSLPLTSLEIIDGDEISPQHLLALSTHHAQFRLPHDLRGGQELP